MSQLSKTEQVLREMKQYNIDILALSEIRWKGVGQETLDHGYVLLYSEEDNHHQAGVGLMMSPTAYRTMLKWTPINEKILFARFATTHTKLSFIVCYAPTNEADDDVKDSFYETLQAVTKDIPKHDVLCVVGDLNAKVGADRKYCPEVLGPHGLVQINENGALLVDFALSNDLVVESGLAETTPRQEPPKIEKAWLARIWGGFDTKYMKPLLTNSHPTLIETMPKFCGPFARLMTTAE
ncbi:hypothetical protein QYM36_010030 [Artemia franciscana]|uniref:Endonuclease/exonuclease/phosphatase domain-containing protein n=1 Tax=Artemia franciscana TaxID=6661 RepID=A0AA88L3E9_ARTSF|nr:hypothetical protein QYM36_010030 [Artemia franciscana]